MKSYRQNNIHIKVPSKWTGDDGLFLIVNPINDCEGKQVIAITTQELEDILYLGTKIMIETDDKILKVQTTRVLSRKKELGGHMKDSNGHGGYISPGTNREYYPISRGGEVSLNITNNQ